MELFLKIPLTEKTQTLDTILQMAGPWLTPPQRKRICKHAADIDGTMITKASSELDPESVLRCTIPDPLPDFDMYECPELMRYEGISVIEKLVSMPGRLDETPFDPLLYVADGLGLDRNIFEPIWNAEFMQGGPWLLAEEGQRASSFRKAIIEGKIQLTWVVLIPEAHHTRIEHKGLILDVALSKKVGEICELQLSTKFGDAFSEADLKELPNAILDALSAQGVPVIGDVERGGFANLGGVKIRLLAIFGAEGTLSASWNPPNEWWPREVVVPLREKPKLLPNEKLLNRVSLREFTISDLSMKYVQGGHPWVTRDRDTERGEHDEGAFVVLKTAKGVLGPVAILSNEEPIVARVWGEAFQSESELEEEISFRLDEAFAARETCFSDMIHTDSFRLINGEVDGFPGITVDKLGPMFRTTVRSKGIFTGYSKIFYDVLRDIDSETMIIEAAHGKDIRLEKSLPQVRILGHGTQQLQKGERLIVRELGLKYWVEPWEGIDVGFFCDQRENRRKLADFVKEDSTWLNLFSHTGAFSIRLAQLGAKTVNVDLSQRYLDWFEDNLALNKMELADHQCHAQDAREFLKKDKSTYEGIIVDPPTAATGDGGFWAVKRDYEALLRQCIQKLAPGGTMLVCRNERSTKGSTEDFVKRITKQSGRKSHFFAAPAGADFPINDAFPEGRSFDGIWVSLD